MSLTPLIIPSSRLFSSPHRRVNAFSVYSLRAALLYIITLEMENTSALRNLLVTIPNFLDQR